MKSRLILILFSSLFGMTAQTQNDLDCPQTQQLSGQITDKMEGEYTVYLQRAEGLIIDSTKTEDGRFGFCLEHAALPFYALKVKEAPRFVFYFLTDFSKATKVEIQSLAKKVVQLEGAPPFEQWEKSRAQVQNLFQKYMQERRKMLPDEQWIPVQQQYDSLFCQIFVSFFNDNPILGISVLHAEMNRLENIAPSWATASKLMDCLKGLSTELKTEPTVVALKARLDVYIYAREGAQIQDFTLAGLYGPLIDSRDYRGNYLLLDFWGSWCKPCIEKNEKLRIRYEELQSKGLTVLTIMMDFSHLLFRDEELEAALEKDPVYPWPHAVLFKSQQSSQIINYYRAYTLPRTVLIDPTGQIIATDRSTPDDLIELISNRQP